MTNEMTPEHLLYWRAYSIIEPFQDHRSDLQAALIAKSLWDVNLKPQDRRPLGDFLLEYGGSFGKPKLAEAPKNTQTVQERTNALLQMALGMAGKKNEKQRAEIEKIRQILAERHRQL